VKIKYKTNHSSCTIIYNRLQSFTVVCSRLQSFTVIHNRFQSFTTAFNRLQSRAQSFTVCVVDHEMNNYVSGFFISRWAKLFISWSTTHTVNDCARDCKRLKAVVKDWKRLWMTVNDCKRLQTTVNDCKRL
jgi:hypothetical protein